MKFAVTVMVDAPSMQAADKVRSELAESLQDAADTEELPKGSSFEVMAVLPCADAELIRDAQAFTGFDEGTRFDDDAPISEADDAVWVQAWVRIPLMEEGT